MAAGGRDDIPTTTGLVLDNVVPGSVDLKGLPANRSKSVCWKSASFIIGVQVAEVFANVGVANNLVIYLTGKLGQSTAMAAENINAWNGTTSLTLTSFIHILTLVNLDPDPDF
ncbi:hypothetical protein ACS0TY_003274 [Phlomoides rotata]